MILPNNGKVRPHTVSQDRREDFKAEGRSFGGGSNENPAALKSDSDQGGRQAAEKGRHAGSTRNKAELSRSLIAKLQVKDHPHYGQVGDLHCLFQV